MDLMIAMEQRFIGAPDGSVWTDSAYDRSFWKRYLTVFDRIQVLARVGLVQAAEWDPKWRCVTSDLVSVAAVPFYVGPVEYFRRRAEVRRRISEAIKPGQATILRVPGQIGTVAADILWSRNLPFAVEVVGDPWDALGPKANSHPLRPVLRRWARLKLAEQCRRAVVSLYVTERTLQLRYPPRGSAVGDLPRRTTHGVSDVEMSETSFVASNVAMAAPAFSDSPVRKTKMRGQFEIVTIASLEQPYKGIDVLLRSLKICNRNGVKLHLSVLGNGRERVPLMQQARDLGIQDDVTFAGQVPAGDEVRNHLDRADLFVLPSRVEGMPRALIEAMGRALPCIATSVGGIPELLSARGLVEPDDARGLAERIQEFARDDTLRARLGMENWNRAKAYSEAMLQPRREAFYRAVMESVQVRAPKENRGQRGEGL